MTNEEIENLIKDSSYIAHDLLGTVYEKVDKDLKEYGLVRSHALILHDLTLKGELTMGDLANRLQVTKQNITVLIDKLEKLGLVERVSSAKDRRIFLIRLSPRGLKAMNKYTEKFRNSLNDTFGSLSPEELELFKNTIATLKGLILKLKSGAGNV